MSAVRWILADLNAGMGVGIRDGLFLGVSRGKGSLTPKVTRFCLRRLTSSKTQQFKRFSRRSVSLSASFAPLLPTSDAT